MSGLFGWCLKLFFYHSATDFTTKNKDYSQCTLVALCRHGLFYFKLRHGRFLI